MLTLLLVTASLGILHMVWAHSGDAIQSNWTTKVPMIDGSIEDVEWSDANAITVSMKHTFGSQIISTTVYAKNDHSNLYLAFATPSPQFKKGDILGLFFDEGSGGGDHDGMLTLGAEDFKELSVDEYYFDAYYYGDGGWSADGLIDGTAIARHHADHYEWEWQIPLNSGDIEHDINAQPGDTLGICIQYGAYGISGFYTWPHDTHPFTDATKYGDLILAIAEPRTWTVDDDGPADFQTIQEAINAANPGDTILVASGTYSENVKVYKSLNIMGKGPSSTVLNALDSSDDSFLVTSDFANISGFTVQGAVQPWRAGIRLRNVDSCNISNNEVIGNSFGIYLMSSPINEISNNHIKFNELFGIALWDSNNNTLILNNVSSSIYGIRLDLSSSNTIVNNKLDTNSIGIHLISSHNNKITDNDASDNSYCGIALEWSDNNSLVANNASSNSMDGIILTDSNNNVVEENIVSHNNLDFWNSIGVSIVGSSDNTIRHNTISANMYGILLLESSGNIVLENDLVTNLNHAIRTERADGNSIYHNNFIDNLGQVYNWEQQSMNVWDDGYPSGGNYWSDYTGVDANGDGLGDTPYIIDADNQDRYPLMDPWVERTVGVKVGDWAKYKYELTWSSTDPNEQPPQDLVDLITNLEWYGIFVLKVFDTTITFQTMMHFMNGTETKTLWVVDIDNGSGNGTYLQNFIAANLSKGHRLCTPAPGQFVWCGWQIEETILRQYVGVVRETNHLNVTNWSFIGRYPPLEFYSIDDFYWDRATGIISEYAHQQNFEREGYVTSLSLIMKIVDTNLWKTPMLSTAIDINPDTLNLRSMGRWITAFIELPKGYSVSDIDVSSIMLNNTVQVDIGAPITIGDYDNDTIPDLMVKFNRAELIRYIYDVQKIKYGNVTLTIIGKLQDGTLFEANDTIMVMLRGDVNNDRVIDILDLALIARALGTNPTFQQGTKWNQWNPNADLNLDNKVDINDLFISGSNYGATIP